ncbi:DUF2884 family protein [Vibrio sp. FNV 38]|nr:DUF2884 family protein [Vibrio sp. FNV 38]
MRVISFLMLTMAFTPSVFAAQCRVDIDNDVHISSERLDIIESDGSKLSVGENNQVTLKGEPLQLTVDQQQALQAYKQRLSDYGPKVKALTDEGLDLALNIVDDIATSIEAPEAFDNLKAAMTDYFSQLQSRYYSNDEFMLPATSFDEFIGQWQEEMDQARALFTSEFFEDAFIALSAKMEQDGSLNLTQMAEDMGQLKTKLEQRFSEHASQLKQGKDSLCEELESIQEQELELHEKIPQLESYRVFTI